MRMELIQPFINAADAVFSDLLQSSAKIIDLTMDEDTYRRKGVAALIAIKGDIEGRVILDLASSRCKSCQPFGRHGAYCQPAIGARDRLRAGEYGYWEFRDAVERPGFSLQSLSAGNSRGGSGFVEHRRYRSHGPGLGNALR